MDISTEQVGSVTVATPQGEYLIASNVEDFRRDVSPIVESRAKVIFDMSHLQFIDSSGIGAILSCLRRLSAAGGDLKLFGLTKPVKAVFQITRMHRIFDSFDSREEALAAAEQAAPNEPKTGS